METFDLFSSLGFLLVNTSFQAKQNLTALFLRAGFDATIDQFIVMSALIGESEITQRQICERSCKNDANLTRILGGMERKGLIYRKRGQDGRSRYVYLSESGRLLHASLAPIVQGYMRKVLSALTEEEINALRTILLKIRGEL